MPLYEYQCDACGRRFEVIQKFSDAPIEACRECGKGPVHKLLSSPAIQFKGSGWYITDYAQKGKTDSATTPASKSSDSKSGDGASESTPAKGDASSASTTTSDSSASKESKE